MGNHGKQFYDPSFAPHTCLLICMKSLLSLSLSASMSLNCCAGKHQLRACLRRQAEKKLLMTESYVSPRQRSLSIYWFCFHSFVAVWWGFFLVLSLLSDSD